MSRCPTCQRTFEDESVRVCPHDGAALAPEPGAAVEPPARRDKIFISYSHNDHGWLKRLQINLTPYFRHGEISVWDDRQIEPGARWFDEINRALASACVAVLLVTPDFLASEFITDVEVPRLREAAEADGLQILWVAVRKSAVTETEIGHYQGLNNPDEPLANLSPAAQDAELDKICKKIKERARPISKQKVAAGGAPDAPRPLALLRSFDLNMADVRLCVVDGRGRLWVSNAQQTKIFALGQERPVAAWLLPRVRWKQHLRGIWREQLVVSDWSGSLYGFGEDAGGRERPLYQGRHEDLPIHLLACGPDGQLVAAAWDGVVRAWDADGRLLERPAATVPHLPLRLLPLAGGALAVVDQSESLRVFDEAGREAWAWRPGGRVERLWRAGDGGARRTFVAQVGGQRLLKVSEGSQAAEELELDGPVTCLAHGPARAGEEWVAVAGEGGRVDWLPTSLFGVVSDNRVSIGQPLKQLLVVHDPQQPASLIALGLTADGQLCTINEREVTFYAAPRPAERMMLDPSGRFLFLVSGSQVGICRNPAVLAAACRVVLAEPVRDRLDVGGYKRVTVKLRNAGAVAIHRLRAELTAARDVIDATRNVRPPACPVAPGECVEMEFNVRAHVAGDLPLELKVEMEDEGGPSPLWEDKLPFSMESRPAT